MSTVVYAPMSGSVWSLDCYCYFTASACSGPNSGCGCGCGSGSGCDSGQGRICAHCAIPGYSSPVDIGGASSGDTLWFYANCPVKSINAEQFTGGCPGQSNSSQWAQSLKITMYDNFGGSGSQLGVVVYHHVANRVSGVINNSDPTGCLYNHYCAIPIGYFTSNCGCSCYSGVHVHMQRGGGSTESMSCGQSLTGGGGGSAIYRW